MPLSGYRFDPSLAFPELIKRVQNTDDCPDEVSAVTIVLAYVAAGHWFNGTSGPADIDILLAEAQKVCDKHNVELERVALWAESLLVPPDADVPQDVLDAIPRRMEGPGFNLHEYQVKRAAWCAMRMGSVAALGCGVGKTAVSIAAAAAASRIGMCSPHRVAIVCPVNALATWQGYTKDLSRYFGEVILASRDSLHHYQHLDDSGGALIFDEAHGLKNDDADRTEYAKKVRLRFEWATSLTGTLLHTGPEGLLTILNLACPGLGRYLNKWTFGEAIKCIARKKAGRRVRQSLVIPGEEHREVLARFLSRGVISLSLTSPEVTAVVDLPSHTSTLVDSWAVPAWIQALLDTNEPDQPPKYLYGSSAPWQVMAGAHYFAMQSERSAFALEEMNASALGETFETAQAADDWLVREIKHRAEQGWEPDKRYKKWLALLRMPIFTAVLQELAREGRYDRCLERYDVPGPAGAPMIMYRYRYADGTSRHAPGPGVKIAFLEQWLADNPDESIAIGSASTGGLRQMEAVLQRAGISYGIIRGGVTSKERKRIEAAFNKHELRVALLQQRAGSESISLVGGAWSALIDHDWSANAYEQYLHRTYRQKQLRPCQHLDLAFNGTQTGIVSRLKGGHDFDAGTRAILEAQWSHRISP